MEVEVDEEVEIFYNKRVMDSGLSGLSGETSLATTNKLPVTADYVLNNRNIRTNNQSMHNFLISHVTINFNLLGISLIPNQLRFHQVGSNIIR